MVLAANKPIRVYGTGKGKATVEFAGTTKTVVSENESWMAEFEPMSYGGPYELKFFCDDKKEVLDNIYVGEVYLFSGQSNVQLKLRETNTPREMYETNDKLRYFSVDKIDDHDHFNASDGWVLCDEETVRHWSAIGYLTAREIAQLKNIKVGVINCNQGASVIESWVPEGAFKRIGIDIPIEQKGDGHKYFAYQAWNKEGRLYEKQLKQVIPFSLSKVVWYQGESDTCPSGAEVYHKELTEMIRIWRKDFKDQNLPFVIVQIADYDMARDPESWKTIQEAQLKVQEMISHVTTVISKDVCETNDIHPPTKTKLAQRIVKALI